MTYRYRLTRRLHPVLGGSRRRLLFCMLNPSTADEKRDDPTIRRCIGFAQRERFTDLVVVNLFAARATNPADLLGLDDPVGSGNDDAIAQEAARADLVVRSVGQPSVHAGARTGGGRPPDTSPPARCLPPRLPHGTRPPAAPAAPREEHAVGSACSARGVTPSGGQCPAGGETIAGMSNFLRSAAIAIAAILALAVPADAQKHRPPQLPAEGQPLSAELVADQAERRRVRLQRRLPRWRRRPVPPRSPSRRRPPRRPPTRRPMRPTRISGMTSCRPATVPSYGATAPRPGPRRPPELPAPRRAKRAGLGAGLVG